MNERIKELAEQAEMSANKGDHVDVKIMMDYITVTAGFVAALLAKQ